MTAVRIGLILVILSSQLAFGQATLELPISTKAIDSSSLAFLPHQGKGPFDTSLAMDISYGPIQEARGAIEKHLKIKLDYFKGWDPKGEAHITVITPPEYYEVLRHKISMTDIEAIAKKANIQGSDVQIFGIGSAAKQVDGKDEETYFLIVDSLNLRKLRTLVFTEFVRRGGSPSAWDPTWFFPHITIGYTKRDLHESDGVIKNIKHSWDKRFSVGTGH